MLTNKCFAPSQINVFSPLCKIIIYSFDNNRFELKYKKSNYGRNFQHLLKKETHITKYKFLYKDILVFFQDT